jgi:hypothetical protein
MIKRAFDSHLLHAAHLDRGLSSSHCLEQINQGPVLGKLKNDKPWTPVVHMYCGRVRVDESGGL